MVGLLVTGAIGVSTCTASPDHDVALAPMAEGVSRASSRWEEIAQRSLLAPDELPSFALAPQPSYTPDDGVELDTCRDLGTLDEKFGQPETAWGIGYRRGAADALDQVGVGQSTVVWTSDEVAERRITPAVRLFGPCRHSQIVHNFSTQLPDDGPVEVADSRLVELPTPSIDHVATDGYRIRITLSAGGLEYPVYYDFYYVAYLHAISVVDIRSQIRPLEREITQDIVEAVADRLMRAQA